MRPHPQAAHTAHRRTPHITTLTLSALVALSALSLSGCMAEMEPGVNLDERCLESAMEEMDITGLTCSCDPLSAQWVCVSETNEGGSSAGVEPDMYDDWVAGMSAQPDPDPPSDPDPSPAPSMTTANEDIAAALGQQGGSEAPPSANNGGADLSCGRWEYASFVTSAELSCAGVRSYISYDVMQSAWIGVRVCPDPNATSQEDEGSARLRVYMSPDKQTFYPMIANEELSSVVCALLGGRQTAWYPDNAELEGLRYAATASGERFEPTERAIEGLSTGRVSCVATSIECLNTP